MFLKIIRVPLPVRGSSSDNRFRSIYQAIIDLLGMTLQEISEECDHRPPQSSVILGRWIGSLDAFSSVRSRSGEAWAVGSGIDTAGMNSNGNKM